MTRERQYKACISDVENHGWERLGWMTSESWRKDPRHLLFNLARYKFVAKMLAEREHVLEIGCGDGFGTRIVRQEVRAVTAADFDPIFIEDAKVRVSPPWTIDFVVHDFRSGPLAGHFDGVYALDVLEHIPVSEERAFLQSALVGMPSRESQSYASEQSRLGHVNCKSAPELRALMSEFFYNVFMFSMNDEVVHTGFHKMAHYIIAVCCSKRVQAGPANQST
jgi:SAM-dependent methyltransferase